MGFKGLMILWEPKMCRFTWQLLGMLGNVLGLLGMLCNVLGMLGNILGLLGMPFSQGPRSLTSKKNPPHLLPYKLWSQRSSVPQSFIYESLVVHYSLGFTAYKAASGGVFFDVRLLGPCKKGMPRTLPSMPRTLQSMPRTLRSMPRTLPSMPRSCQASLHILGSHRYY